MTHLLFFSYSSTDRRHVTMAFRPQLERDGYRVWIDHDGLRGGTDWEAGIRRALEAADALLVFISRAAVASEWVTREVELALELGVPVIPLRIEDIPLPDRIAHLHWRNFIYPEYFQVDYARLLDDLAGLMGAGPRTANQPIATPSPDRHVESPRGYVRPGSPFYVERAADADLRMLLRSPQSATVVVKAPQHMGKTSLVQRALHGVADEGRPVALLDFALLNDLHLADETRFLQHFCRWIASALGRDDLKGAVDKMWNPFLSPIDLCSRFLQNVILKEYPAGLVLAVDEADRLFGRPFSADFFGMVRYWHNNRAERPAWAGLDLLLVIATEPDALITDRHQSPFNVATLVEVGEFTEEEVAELNVRHGTPVDEAGLVDLMDLLGGHPYLLREALYQITLGQATLPGLLESAGGPRGPFADHLREMALLLESDAQLITAMQEVIATHDTPSDNALRRLHSAGLVRIEGAAVLPRCRLYEFHFGDSKA